MEDGKGLFENTVVLQVIWRKPGASRKGDLSLVETAADKDRLSLSKKVLACDEYTAIGAVASDFSRWLKRRELDCAMFRAGRHLIPVETLPDVYERLDKAEADYYTAVDAFVAVYPAIIERSKAELADQARDEDYPAIESIRQAFGVERNVLDFAPPGTSKVGQVMSARAAKDFRDQVRAAIPDVIAGLREAAKTVFSRLAEKLAPRADGKKSVLKDATIEAAREFLQLFGSRNVCNDRELADVLAKAQAMLDGKTPDDLRGDGREFFAAKAAEITANLDALVKAGPVRMFSFDEE